MAATAAMAAAARALPQATHGTLFVYGRHGMAALHFEPVPLDRPHGLIAVLVGGLTDGLLNFSYLPILRDALATADVPLLQVMLRTAYRQYGFGSVAQDVDDLDELADTLEQHLGRPPRLLLIGHSTGCQVWGPGGIGEV